MKLKRISMTGTSATIAQEREQADQVTHTANGGERDTGERGHAGRDHATHPRL